MKKTKAPRSKSQSRRFVTLFGASVVFLAVVVSGIWLAREPDFELRFERSVPYQGSFDRAVRNLSDIRTWTEWFHSVEKVTGTLEAGKTVTLYVNPRKGEWKKFSVELHIMEMVKTPELTRLTVRVWGDSKGKLQRVFDDISWRIEARPGHILGAARARTRHWRSRLTGRLDPVSVMNQVFYPDLMRLATRLDPSSPGAHSEGQGVNLSPRGM